MTPTLIIFMVLTALSVVPIAAGLRDRIIGLTSGEVTTFDPKPTFAPPVRNRPPLTAFTPSGGLPAAALPKYSRKTADSAAT